MVVRVRGMEAELFGPLPGLLSFSPPMDGEDHRAQTHVPDDTPGLLAAMDMPTDEVRERHADVATGAATVAS